MAATGTLKSIIEYVMTAPLAEVQQALSIAAVIVAQRGNGTATVRVGAPRSHKAKRPGLPAPAPVAVAPALTPLVPVAAAAPAPAPTASPRKQRGRPRLKPGPKPGGAVARRRQPARPVTVGDLAASSAADFPPPIPALAELPEQVDVDVTDDVDVE